MTTPAQETPQQRVARLQSELAAAEQESQAAPPDVQANIVQTAIVDGCEFCEKELVSFLTSIGRALGVTVPEHTAEHDQQNADAKAADAAQAPPPPSTSTP